MKRKRKLHNEKIEKFHRTKEEMENDEKLQLIERSDGDYSDDNLEQDGSKNRKRKKRKGKAFEPSEMRDKQNYIPHQPSDKVTEEG